MAVVGTGRPCCTPIPQRAREAEGAGDWVEFPRTVQRLAELASRGGSCRMRAAFGGRLDPRRLFLQED